MKYQSTGLSRALILCLMMTGMAACGGGGGGGGGGGSSSGNGGGSGSPPPAAGEISVSGTISFDKVPHASDSAALDYANTQQLPARGVLVQALANDNSLLAQASSDGNGFYSLNIPQGTSFRIQVLARMANTGSASWHVEVRDNTQGGAIYGLISNTQSGANENITLNLHAASGWGGVAYTQPRAAAPFTLLNDIYDSMDIVLAVAPNTQFPPLDVFWSVNNSTAPGTIESGGLGSSFYTNGAIYILGDENGDTDEYDSHVVTHEWGHYFEDQLSRADSIGGPHSLGQRIDFRLAFGEGWGNALSAMITGDPIYKDSQGIAQQGGFGFNVEDNTFDNPGWFSEASVQSLLYNLFDSNNLDGDTLSLGFGPIFSALTNGNYVNNTAFTSIYSFAAELERQNPSITNALRSMLRSESIEGFGFSGENESNNGGLSATLPVYKNTSQTLCSSNAYGQYNRLGNRDYARFDIGSSGNYTITVSQTAALASSNPDFLLFRNGVLIARGESNQSLGTESQTLPLSPGSYALEIYDRSNVNGGLNSGSYCYNISVSS